MEEVKGKRVGVRGRFRRMEGETEVVGGRKLEEMRMWWGKGWGGGGGGWGWGGGGG